MFREYDSFRLRKPIPGEHIPMGAPGVVLMVFDVHAYEVEFPDGQGGNLGSESTFTLTDDYMEPVEFG